MINFFVFLLIKNGKRVSVVLKWETHILIVIARSFWWYSSRTRNVNMLDIVSCKRLEEKYRLRKYS